MVLEILRDFVDGLARGLGLFVSQRSDLTHFVASAHAPSARRQGN